MGTPRGFGSPVSMKRRQNVLIVSKSDWSARFSTCAVGAAKLLPKTRFDSNP
jgi:hypothetical protein